MAEFEKILIEFFTGDGMTIARTVAVFIFGLLAVKLILLIVNKLSVRAHIDKTISSFVLSVVGVLLYFGLLLLTGKSAGISTASFVALISAAGLAISLALKDSLSNLANGFIILGSKPFVVGDYVAVNGVEGTVKSIGFFNTCDLRQSDNHFAQLLAYRQRRGELQHESDEKGCLQTALFIRRGCRKGQKDYA